MSKKISGRIFSKASSKELASQVLRPHVHHGASRQKLKDAGEFAITSIGTERNYTQSLKQFQDWIVDVRKSGMAPKDFPRDVRELTKEVAMTYLAERSETVRQKQLDQDRMAITVALQEKLERVQSEVGEKGELAQQSRSYTNDQLAYIQEHMKPHNALAVKVAREAGLRAHELFTLRPIEEQKPSDRAWSKNIWVDRKTMGGRAYTVKGKGGLTRTVYLTKETAKELEATRLEKPQEIRERDVKYTKNYAIGGGKNLTDTFNRVSNRVLGWSNGLHGTRHSFAQERVAIHQSNKMLYDDAVKATSQEIGHFSIKNTLEYLR